MCKSEGPGVSENCVEIRGSRGLRELCVNQRSRGLRELYVNRMVPGSQRIVCKSDGPGVSENCA